MAVSPKHIDLILGPLPVTVVNRTIGTELDEGDVILSVAAQKHAAQRHPEDYARCLPHLGAVVTSPLYIGDDHRNPGKIELIGRVAAMGAALLLVAVAIEQDASGRYHVTSFYPISDAKAQSRRERGFLKLPRKS